MRSVTAVRFRWATRFSLLLSAVLIAACSPARPTAVLTPLPATPSSGLLTGSTFRASPPPAISSLPSSGGLTPGGLTVVVTPPLPPNALATLPPAVVISDLAPADQALVDTAFGGLSDNDSFAFDLNLTVQVVSPGGVPQPFTLRGTGFITGLSATGGISGLDVTLTTQVVVNNQLADLTIEARLIGTSAYFRVSGTAGGAVSDTGWTVATLEDMLGTAAGGVLIGPDAAAATPLLLPELPDDFALESLFGDWLDLTGFIASERLPDDAGGVAVFRRTIDLIGFVASGRLANVIGLIEGISPGAAGGLSPADAGAQFQQLGAILPVILPEASIVFTQAVNPDGTMNRLAFDLDFRADEGVLQGQPPVTDQARLTEADLDLIIAFSRHGDAFVLEVPPNAVPMAQLTVVPLMTPVGQGP